MSAVMDAVEPGLSKQQHSTYIAVIESLLKVATPAQFIQWVKGELQTLFPHEMFVGGIGHIKRDSIKIEHILSAGFPIEYVQAIQRPDGDVSSPIMALWCREQRIEYESNRGQQRFSMILRNIKRGLLFMLIYVTQYVSQFTNASIVSSASTGNNFLYGGAGVSPLAGLGASLTVEKIGDDTIEWRAAA